MDTTPPVAPKLVTSAAFSYVINPRVTVQTSMGTVVVELYPDQAPVTVANMLAYTNAGFYTGTLFHRVIPGFMDQGGGYTAGAAGMVYKTPTYSVIPLESNNGLSNLRGTIAMARTDVPDSASSQFFINQADNLFLNYSTAPPGYAVFGRVVTGLAVIDSIAVVPRTTSNQPTTDITITSVQQTLAGSALAAAGSTISVSDLEAGASWRYSLDSGSTWTPGTGTSFAVPAGSYAANAIQVSQTDDSGNVSLTTGKLTSALIAQTGLSRVTVSLADNLPSTANLSTNAVVYTLAFSEAVTGLDASDLTVMNGSVGAISGSGTNWSVSVTPAAGVANGAISLMVKAGAVTTVNGGYNTSAVNSSQLVDTLAPVAPLLVPGTAVRFLQAPQLTLQTSLGAVLIELNPDKAPVTVATVLANANSGFYDSTLFHTVVPGVAVQGGAYSSTLAYKAPAYSTIPLESINTLTHQVGSVAMLRASSTLSDGAQFFVDLAANPSLNYASATAPGYAVFGQVLSGMGVINSMAQVPLSTTGVPLSPITLTAMQQTQTGSAVTRVGSFAVAALTSTTAWSYSLDAGGNWVSGSGSNLALPDGSYAANAIQVRQVDGAGNLSPVGKFSSALVVDSIAPTVSSFNPLDEATGVPKASHLALTFSENIYLGSGNITLKTAAGAVVESFDTASSPRLSLSGNTLSIDPTLDLSPGTGYTLALDAGTLKDLAGNPFAGGNSYNFNTAMALNVLTYTWRAHTLLSDVSVSNRALSHVTAGDGAINFEVTPAATQTLTASRAVPAAEASLTSSAVNLQDAIAILKMIVGLDVNGAGRPLSPYQALAADYDGNGVVQLTDAIGVLKHVVGLTAPQPTWHFVNELDAAVPTKANLTPGVPQTSISANTSGSSPVHVGLVGYLSGDVDGSFAGAPGALDLDVPDTGYFTSLTAASGLNMTQFGVYGA